jgi:hypothetical protein
VESNRVLTVRNTNVEIFPVSSRGEVGSAGRLSLDLEFAPGPFHRGSFAASFGEKGVGNIAWFAFGQGFDSTGIVPMMHSRYVVHHLAFTMTRSGVAVAGQGDLGLPRTESATAVAIGSQVLAVASTDDFSKAGRIRLYRVP